MPSIAWITDVPGWAYDRRARTLAAALPGYEHRIVTYAHMPRLPMLDADLIVCPYPPLFMDPRFERYLRPRERVIVNLNAVKIFEARP